MSNFLFISLILYRSARSLCPNCCFQTYGHLLLITLTLKRGIIPGRMSNGQRPQNRANPILHLRPRVLTGLIIRILWLPSLNGVGGL